MESTDKLYYRIRDVAEMLGVPPSTLRFWEKEFPEYAPRRSSGNTRYYTPADIEKFRMIHYLLKGEGLRIEAARERLASNSENISKRVEVITRLRRVRSELQEMLSALVKRR